MIQASMIMVGAKFLKSYASLQEAYNMSPTLAAMCFAGVGIFLGLLIMILVAIMLSVKVKED